MSRRRLAILKQSSHLQGGLEKQSLGIIRSLIDRGWEVDLLCQGPMRWPATSWPAADWAAMSGLRILPLSSKTKFSYFSLKYYDSSVRQWLAQNAYDLVLGLERHSQQTHYRAGSGVHRYFLDQRLKRAGFFKRLALQLNPFHRLTLELEAKTFGPDGARRIYTNSHMVARQIEQYYGTSTARLRVIHNGVAWLSCQGDFDKSLERPPALFHSLGLSADKRYLLFLGNDYQRKGLTTLLHALAKSNTDFHLIVAGKDRSKESYQRLATQLGLEKCVHWMEGPIKPIQLYSVAEALALPTLYDPFANVTLEALAMGVYALTSTHDGAREVIGDDCGHALPAQDIPSWTVALQMVSRRPVTSEQRLQIRSSVQHLEWSQQLNLLIDDLTSS